MRPYSPGGALNALAPAPGGSLPQAPSAHRLRRGLPGYLILFAPHAVAPQRQPALASLPAQRAAFATGVLPDLYAFHRYTRNSACLYSARAAAVSLADAGLSPALSPKTDRATYAPFTPNDSGQRSHPPYYRGCWHGVSRCFLTRYRQTPRKALFVPGNSGLHSEKRHPTRGVAASAFRPLRKIPHCCLP